MSDKTTSEWTEEWVIQNRGNPSGLANTHNAALAAERDHYKRNIDRISQQLAAAVEANKAAKDLAERCPREQCYDEWKALDAALTKVKEGK